MLEMLVEKEVTVRSIPLKPQLSPTLRQASQSLVCWSLENFQGWVCTASQDNPLQPCSPITTTIFFLTEKSWAAFCLQLWSCRPYSHLLPEPNQHSCLSLFASPVRLGLDCLTAFHGIFWESSTSLSSWRVQKLVFQVNLDRHWVKGFNEKPAGCSPPKVCV